MTGKLRALVLDGDYGRLAELVPELDDVVGLAELLCDVEGREEYLGTDLPLVRLLEDVLARVPAAEDRCRARLQARLALELRGDPTSVGRRVELLTSAAELAERQGDPAALVDVLLARVHAVWEPEGAHEWATVTDRAVAVARQARLLDKELYARRTRVDALLALGRVVDAEVEVGHLTRLVPPADAGWQAFLASRRGAVAVVFGRFEEAVRAADEAEAFATSAQLPDRLQLIASLRAMIARERGDADELREHSELLSEVARRYPGHHFEAPRARSLLETGRREEARVELARAVASLRARRGTTWLVSCYDAGVTASAIGTDDDRSWLLTALRNCGADWACIAVWLCGSTHVAAGMLAASLEQWPEALELLDRGIADIDAIGALPWAARARRVRAGVHRALGDPARADADDRRATEISHGLGMSELPRPPESAPWTLRRVGAGWHLVAGDEEAHLRGSRGLEHLRELVANPGKEIPALYLESGGETDVPQAGLAMLDAEATRGYRARLRDIEAELDEADRRGDPSAAIALESEREALAAELRRAVGLGGRARTTSDASERARVNVTRSIRRAIDQIAQSAPQAAAHLARSVRTGTVCRYLPDGSQGPTDWHTG